MRLISSLLIAGTLMLTSCETDSIDEFLNSGLSEAEITEGLKEALKVGTDTATKILSVKDGYLKDQAVKILLPDEVQSSISNFKSKSFKVLGITVTGEMLYEGYQNNLLGINIESLKGKEDDLIVGINRAAEDAAKTAGPIFLDAILDITIQDANNILFGDNNKAATEYLASRTSTHLFNEYEPRIDNALSSIKIGGSSVVDSYESFVADYNAILNTQVPGAGSIGSLMNIQTIAATDISVHATNKGLDGLFLKVGDEEAQIRKDPLARVNAILQKVFGELD
ncbi:MAG: hypothetical protein CMI36_14695 [Owenweeksia sp.]|nr:hypothetical protein [Owenweeksia sp.]MBG00239.1 hypothetical protein [Owenweeksia sp.]HBF19687.1 DUF4197 domain-containing protein [Cryomorphaceae bacterium]|tara:strand:+ start:273 stop:1118 length:846 start_codon:yes stop_codon:yes gene_type:complete